LTPTQIGIKAAAGDRIVMPAFLRDATFANVGIIAFAGMGIPDVLDEFVRVCATCRL